MLRIGFLPSDFNPMVLMLGESEDLHRLAATLRRFAREPADAPLDASRIRLTASDGPLGIHATGDPDGTFLWRLDAAHAATLRRPDRCPGSAGAAGRVGNPRMHDRGGNPGQSLARRIHRRLPAYRLIFVASATRKQSRMTKRSGHHHPHSGRVSDASHQQPRQQKTVCTSSSIRATPRSCSPCRSMTTRCRTSPASPSGAPRPARKSPWPTGSPSPPACPARRRRRNGRHPTRRRSRNSAGWMCRPTASRLRSPTGSRRCISPARARRCVTGRRYHSPWRRWSRNTPNSKPASPGATSPHRPTRTNSRTRTSGHPARIRRPSTRALPGAVSVAWRRRAAEAAGLHR